MRYLTVLGFLFCSVFLFGQTNDLDYKFSQLSNQAESLDFLQELFSDYQINPTLYQSTRTFNPLIVNGIIDKRLLLDQEANEWLRLYLSSDDESIRNQNEIKLVSKL